MPTNVERVVSIIFQGDDRISKTISGISTGMGKLEDAIGRVADPFARLGDGVLKADAALLALSVTTAAYSIKKFAEFEDVMLKVKGVIGANEDEYKSLTELTRNLGETTRYTATEAAQGLQFLALAGFDVAESIGALPEVLNLAQAAGMDLGDTADIVTNIMAGYGIEVDKLTSANDVLTATFTNSNTSLDQLGQAFKFVGPVAKGLGFELQETAAILGILGNAGYQAEKGGTSLRNILLALVAPAGNVGKLMKELGVDTTALGVDFADSANALRSLGVQVKDSAGNLRPFTEIMDQLSVGLAKIQDPADRAATLVEIFGKRGGPQMAALLNQGSDAVKDLEDKIGELGGVTSKIAAEMESGMGGAMRSLRSALEGVFLGIGDMLSPAAVGVTEGARDIIRAIGREINTESLGDVFSAIDQFADDITAAMDSIARNLPQAFDSVDWSDLVGAVDDLTHQFRQLFDGIDLRSTEGLSDALQAVIDTITSLVRVTQGMVAYLDPVWDSIREGVGRFNELDAASQRAAGEFLGAAELVAKAGVKIGTALIAIEKSGADIERVYNAVAGSVRFAWNNLEIVFSRMAQLVVNFTRAVTFIPEKLSGIVPGLDGLHDGIADFRRELDIMNASFQEEVGKNSKQAINGLEQAMGRLTDTTSVAADRSVDMADKIGGAFFTAKDDVEGLVDEIHGMLDKDAEVTVKPVLDEQGTQEVKRALASLSSEVESQLKDVAGSIVDDIRGEGGVQDAAEEKLKATARSMVEEIRDASEQMSRSVSGIFDAAAGAGTSALKELTDLQKEGKYSYAAEAYLDDQLKMQKQLARAQRENIEAQTDLLESRKKYYDKGEALIKITGDGLQPHLEAFMWEILERIQVRATEEGASFLLGAS